MHLKDAVEALQYCYGDTWLNFDDPRYGQLTDLDRAKRVAKCNDQDYLFTGKINNILSETKIFAILTGDDHYNITATFTEDVGSKLKRGQVIRFKATMTQISETYNYAKDAELLDK